ncbi:MAG: hypothetical protein ACTSRE_08280 [Promethearchaeota archaeon]
MPKIIEKVEKSVTPRVHFRISIKKKEAWVKYAESLDTTLSRMIINSVDRVMNLETQDNEILDIEEEETKTEKELREMKEIIVSIQSNLSSQSGAPVSSKVIENSILAHLSNKPMSFKNLMEKVGLNFDNNSDLDQMNSAIQELEIEEHIEQDMKTMYWRLK